VISGGGQVFDAEGRDDVYPPDLVEEEHVRGEDKDPGRGRTDDKGVAVDVAGGRERRRSGRDRGGRGRIGRGCGRGRGRGRGQERGEIDPPDLVEEECGRGEYGGGSGRGRIGHGCRRGNGQGRGRKGRENGLPPNSPDLTTVLAEETHRRNRARAYALGLPMLASPRQYDNYLTPLKRHEGKLQGNVGEQW